MDHPPNGGEVPCMSTSNEDVNSAEMQNTVGSSEDANLAEIQNTVGMFNPDVPIEMKPKIGMEFASLEDGYDFYNTYGWHSGFSVRKDNTRTLKTGEISRCVLVCSKAGVREGKVISEENRKRRHSIMTRCSCPAKVHLNLKDRQQMVYHITQFVETHNHVLCTPTKTRRLRSHKKITEDDLNLITSLKASGIGVARSLDFMRSDAGGPSHLRFSERDARNAILRQRLKKYGSDANNLLQYFQSKKEAEPLFHYKIQVDDESRLTSCFWVDVKSQEDYMVFGDVVCFDTTYKTNEYDMPFGPFVGVNHHMQTILLGAGLLFGETVEDFKWLFRTWLHAMGDVHPKTIITDQDAAIGAAVAAVFPDANHLLCLWHIQKKLPEKLSHIIREHPRFKEYWNNCLYGTMCAEKFDNSWHAMIEDFELHDNSWMRHMFEIRHQWIPAYTKIVFSAGMRTTGRSESMNAFFDGFVTHKSSLINFANGYEKALERRREAEEEADFHCSNGRPVLKTRHNIEAQMADFFTLNLFIIFQKEVEESMYYIAEKVGDDGVVQQWQVFKYEDHTRSKRKCLSWDADTMHASCSCMKFESSGIVCRHIITLFRCVQVVNMPTSYMLPRWSKTAKAQFKRVYTASPNIATQSRAVRQHAFSRWVSYIGHEFLSNPEVCEVVRENMEKLISILQAMPRRRELEAEVVEQPTAVAGVAGDNFNSTEAGLDTLAVHMVGGSSGMLGTQSSQTGGILDPHVVKTKGRTAKRAKGPLEAPRSGAKLCRGCNKWVVGHDKRNCPVLIVSSTRGRGPGRQGGTN